MGRTGACCTGNGNYQRIGNGGVTSQGRKEQALEAGRAEP